MPGWQRCVAGVREHVGDRAVVTSGWPALLLASAAGLTVHGHVAHNVESLIAAEHAPRALRALGEEWRLRRAERRLLALPRSVFTLSRVDADRLAAWDVHADVLPLPLHEVPSSDGPRPRRVGFIGKATWPPNARALEVLLGPVHERLARAGVDVPFVLAGVGTEEFAEHPRVERAGWVEDARDFYDQIGLAVVPRLGGSTGISVKMLEAAEHGVPSVVPAALALAIDPNGPWTTADDESSIADAIEDWWGGAEPTSPAPWVRAHDASATAAALLSRLT
jgi:glycosyltransferase involved in cell wall biosynthesis